MLTLKESVKIIRVEAAAVAAQTALTTDAVDTKGFEGCMFIALLGSIAAGGVATLKAQQSSDDDSDTYADLLGTAIANVAAGEGDDNLLVLDIHQPRERYLKAVLTRATGDIACGGIIALLYGPDKEPTTHDDTVEAIELHHAPAEGTA